MQNDPDTRSVDGDSDLDSNASDPWVDEDSASEASIHKDPASKSSAAGDRLFNFDINRTSAWFLKNNVSLAGDVGNEAPSLLFKARQKESTDVKQPKLPVSGQNAQEATELSIEFYEELQSLVTSTWVPNFEGKLPTDTTGVVVSSRIKNSGAMIDEMVHHLAKDLGADLISLGTDDIEELACDFARDEQSFTSEEYRVNAEYFAVRCQNHASKDTWDRSLASFAAVLGAADIKALEETRHNKNKCDAYRTCDIPERPALSRSTPLLIHCRGTEIMWEQYHGHKFFARMHHHIKQRRIVGAVVTAIITLSPRLKWDKELFKLVCKTEIPVHKILLLNQAHVFSRGSLFDSRRNEATSSNIRRLRYKLRQRVPHLFPPGLLDSDAGWADALGSATTMQSSRWSDDELDSAIAQVAGRAWQKSQVDGEDLKIVLERMLLKMGPGDESDDDAENDSDDDNPTSRWSNFPERVQKLARKLERSNPLMPPRELEFMDHLVHPENVENGWSDIVLEPDILEGIKQLIPQINDAPQHRSPYGILKQGNIGGALVYGPPGTGKTQLARVIAAQRSDLVVLCVSAADIEDSFVGQSEKNIKALFHLGKMLAPSLIFMDEADSLLLGRTPEDYSWERQRLNQFLGEMDGLNRSKNSPFVLLSTNLPGDLDPAVLRRVSGTLYIGLPTTDSRAQIFRIMLRDEVLDSDVDFVELAWMTAGFSGSDIRTLCVQAALMCKTFVEEDTENKGKRLLSSTLFEKALSRTNRTVTKYIMRPIAEFAKEHDQTAYRRIKMSMSVRYMRNHEKTRLTDWAEVNGEFLSDSDMDSTGEGSVDDINLGRPAKKQDRIDKESGKTFERPPSEDRLAEGSASEDGANGATDVDPADPAEPPGRQVGAGISNSYLNPIFPAATADLRNARLETVPDDSDKLTPNPMLNRSRPPVPLKPRKLKHVVSNSNRDGSSAMDAKLDETSISLGTAAEHLENSRLTRGVVAAGREDLYAAIPLNDGSKRIRVLTIAPADRSRQNKTPPLISCTLEVVDLEDWTVEYSSFRRRMEGRKYSNRYVEARVQFALWCMHGRRRPDGDIPTVLDSELGLLQADVDQPLDRFENLQNRYTWGDYIALSYVWGSPAPQKTILLNGVPHQVGLNLYDALSRLRESYEVQTQGLKVWIDALCINQQNLQEKASEVPKMGIVYSEALAVRAWLGRPSSEIEAHFEWLRAAMEECGIAKLPRGISLSSKSKWIQLTSFMVARKQFFWMCGEEETAQKVSSVLASVFSEVYWYRLWIIQELALAPSLVFWYGDNGVFLTVELAMLTSKSLWSFSGLLSRILRQNNTKNNSEALVVIENGLKQIRYRIGDLRWHESRQCQHREKPLWQLIDEGRAAEAKDPRDKVYGLFDLLPRSISGHIMPSYDPNFTVADCYVMFAKTCFEAQGNLSLLARLSGIALGVTKEHLASWAFDLHTPMSRSKILPHQDLNHILTEPLGLMCPTVLGRTETGHTSDVGLKGQFQFPADSRLLSCHAVFVDNVNSVADWGTETAIDPRTPESSQLRVAVETEGQDPRLVLARVLTNNATYNFTDHSSLLDVPWATLTKDVEESDNEESDWHKNWRETVRGLDISGGNGDMDPEDFEFGSDLPVPWDECFRHFFSRQAISCLLLPVRRFQLRGVPFESYFYSHEEYCYDLMRFRRAVHATAVVLWYRRLCETESGMLGSVPVGTRPGDRIAVICGCDMPVVLRPHANNYMVVGGCFVEGIMRGEAAERVRKGQLAVERISLC